MSRYSSGNKYINIADGVQITPLGIEPPMIKESSSNLLESSISNNKMLASVRDELGADSKFWFHSV